MPCLSLALSLCPSPHRHNARQFQGWVQVGVGVARARFLPALLVARLARWPCVRPCAPPPPLRPPLVSVPLPPSSPSREPLRRPCGAVLVRAIFFFRRRWGGGRGGGGGRSCWPFLWCMHLAGTMRARGVALVCKGGGLLPFPSLFPSWPPCLPRFPSGLLCGWGGLLFGSLRYPSCLVSPLLEASMMHAQCKHNHHTVTTVFFCHWNGFLSTWRQSPGLAHVVSDPCLLPPVPSFTGGGTYQGGDRR